MALTYAFNRQRFLQMIAAQGSLRSFELLTFSREVFRKAQIVQNAFNHLDDDKLHKMTSRETQRLHRFARQFPFDQHLLNLQALMVAVLTDLSSKMADPQTSVNDLRRALSRIVLLTQEIAEHAAKAIRHKDETLAKPHRLDRVYKLIQEVVKTHKLSEDEDQELTHIARLRPA